MGTMASFSRQPAFFVPDDTSFYYVKPCVTFKLYRLVRLVE